ncbi:ras-specific guanine nucleotide-releasing factor RalGPS2-like isoform 2 [Cricetulus griseus]|nr:ras-specific guanine nucleotide-releasing factor RalGPS2-like isoform 2 [Cricetulus griseus]
MDIPVFKAIQPEDIEPPNAQELASCGWSKKEKHSLAPNVVAFTRRFNQIQIQCCCQEVNQEYSVLSGIVYLVIPILFLQKFQDSELAQQLLNRKDKTTFEKLDYLMSKEDNYKRTRDYIRSLKMVPSIPYLV